jgi:pyrrolidone-carboxylate peptidase
MKILLTGYGPFRKRDGHEVKENISAKIIKDIILSLDKKSLQISGIVMPVEWQASEEIFERNFFLHRPSLVISMGHAAGYPALTIEKKYFNLARGLDVKKRKRKKGIIKPDGNAYYLTNLDVEKLKNHLEKKDIPVTIHSGKQGMDYLCNFSGYLSAYYSQKLIPKTKYLFIHVPAPEDISYDVSFLGITEIINFATRPSYNSP